MNTLSLNDGMVEAYLLCKHSQNLWRQVRSVLGVFLLNNCQILYKEF